MTEEEKVAFLKVKGYVEERYGFLDIQDLRKIINVVEREILKNE